LQHFDSKDHDMKGRSLFVVALASFLSPAKVGYAAQLKVFAPVTLMSVLEDLAPAYQNKTGDELLITYDMSLGLMKRVTDNEPVDVVILTEAMINDLQKQGKVAAGSGAVIADTEVSLVARGGAAKPDISSVDALKQALLAAKSVAYSDPADGGLSGMVAKHTIEQLGIAARIAEKTVLAPGGQAGVVVAKGDAELGIAQASEIVPVAGTQLIGPLPGGLANMTILAGGISAKSTSADCAKALIEFLAGPEAAVSLKANGFDPRDAQHQR
jgi:molybdate transport system substrate-binding protein